MFLIGRGAHEPHRSHAPPRFSLPAFTALLDQWQLPLFRFLRQMVGDEEEARDLLQDTFYDAWRAAQRDSTPLDPSRGERTVRSWLFHAAYNRAVSALRRRKVIRWETLDDEANFSEDSASVLMPFEDRIVERDALRTALAQLSPGDVACLILIIVQEFSPAEAAQIMGKSTAAITRQFSRARQRLHRAYVAQNTPMQERSPS